MINIPTISQLRQNIQADLESTYGGTIPAFGKNFLRAIAAVQAAKLRLYYLAIGDLQKNIFIDTADSELQGGTLERFGRVKLGRNPNPATAGQYQLEITGSIGAVIPASTTFKSDDTSANPGMLYVLDSEYTLVATTDSIIVRALESGLESKLEINDTLTSTSPIANVDSAATVLSESVEPLAAETLDQYRDLGIEAYRLEPQGGAPSDYRIWSEDAQGVETVYPYAKSGAAGEIELYVEATIADSIDGKGTPSQAILDDVEAVVEFDPDTTKPLNERGRRPLGVFNIDFLPINALDIDITINGYDGLTSEIQTKIQNALDLEIGKIRPYISGADVFADKNDILDLNKIISVILAAQPGSIFSSVSFDVDGGGFSSYTFDNGNIPFLNSISYI